VGLLGFFFTLMGLFLAALFSSWDIFQDWRLAAAELATAPGQVLSVERTGLRVNRQRVVRYKFAFQPRPGVRLQGDCFTTGAQWREGDAITVKYSVSDPALGCIDGARLSQGGPVGLVVLLFPALGLGLLISVFAGRRRMNWLMEHGEVAEATVTGLESTVVQINGRRVFKITLQRTDPAGGAPFVLRKHQPAQVEFARQRLETTEPVFVLYDPAHPRRALLPEAL
jgi:hypothetical protein